MISIHNIITVSRYEARILRRSWLFRLFSLGALAILTIMNIGVISPIGDQDWMFLAVPSSIPYLSLYLLNIGQALIIVFLASDFMKKDKKLDTNEVLYTRSMSNLEYILGKSWGITRLFIAINLLVLAIALVVNLIATDTYVDPLSYLTSLLVVSIPTIIYSLGLAFLLMSVVRNQAITFLLLLGYAALDMFYLYYRADYIFDYMMFGMPAFESQITGYASLLMLIAHRLLYALAGVAFVAITVLLFKRLPQSRSHAVITVAILLLSISGATLSGLKYYNAYRTNELLREETVDLNRVYEKSPFITVDRMDISLSHTGEEIECSVDLDGINRSGSVIDTVIFSLNPGLTVLSAEAGGAEAKVSQRGHIILVAPRRAVQLGDTVNVKLSYSGRPEEAYLYPWFTPNPKEQGVRIGPLPLASHYLFVKEDYLLLTPEAHWYPVASLNYYPSNPARIKVDFTRYTLEVNHGDGLVAVSQGERLESENITRFVPETPMTGISLIAGDYTSDSLVVDSLLITTWYKPGNNFYADALNEIGDTIPMLVSGMLTELETNFNTSYPFKRISLVEVPVYFSSVEKKNTQTLAQVQPSMILLPEKLSTLQSGAFYRIIKRNKRRMERNNEVVTDRELQVRAFNNFVRESFISGTVYNYRNNVRSETPSKYLLGPSYYFFKNNFYSTEYPVINAVFESHLQKVNSGGPGRGFLGGLAENDRANSILRGSSLQNILALDPSNDTLQLILSVKGDYLFNLIRAEAGPDKFNKWFTGYIDECRFRNVSLEEFAADVEENFGFDLLPSMDNWFGGSGQPGFYFTSFTAREIVVGNRTRYLVTFDASNPEDTEGIFTVTIRTMGRGGRGGGMPPGGGRGEFMAQGPARGMDINQVDRIVRMDPRQAKQVSIIVDAEPRAVSINTLTSINNPGEMVFPVGTVIKDPRFQAAEGEFVLPSIPLFHEENEIIVDNEDAGFSYFEQTATGRLKRWLGIAGEDRDRYQEMFQWWAPEYWAKTVQNNFYGKYIKSAYYTRGGTGERSAEWVAPLQGPGYYQVYAYIQGSAMRGGGPGGMGAPPPARGRRNNQKDLHFTIYHDQGEDEVTMETENADMGWNHLGSFYFSSDSARVMLTNRTEGRTVSADAVRWIKQK